MDVTLGRFGDLRLQKGGPVAGPTSQRGATVHARIAGLSDGRHILAIQDTTILRDDGSQCSLNLHAMIAVDADDGAMLGLEFTNEVQHPAKVLPL